MGAHASFRIKPGPKVRCNTYEAGNPIVTVDGGDVAGQDGWNFTVSLAASDPAEITSDDLEAARSIAGGFADWLREIERLVADGRTQAPISAAVAL